MKKERGSNKVKIDFYEVDFGKLFRVGSKVNDLIVRKIKKPTHAYLLLKLLCIFFEENFGFRLKAEDENKLRKMLVEESEENEV